MARSLLGGADQTRAERMLQPLLNSSSEEMRQQAIALMKQNANADDKAALAFRGMEPGQDALDKQRAPKRRDCGKRSRKCVAQRHDRVASVGECRPRQL